MNYYYTLPTTHPTLIYNIFEMSNFSFNPHASNHSNINFSDSNFDLMQKLRDLQEVQDESRGEQCPGTLLE